MLLERKTVVTGHDMPNNRPCLKTVYVLDHDTPLLKLLVSCTTALSSTKKTSVSDHCLFVYFDLKMSHVVNHDLLLKLLLMHNILAQFYC